MTVAAQSLELRIVTPDDHTVIDLGTLQGLWTQAQYLELTDHAKLLLEFTDGHLEVLPMPTDRHQAISQYLFLALLPFVGLSAARCTTLHFACAFGMASSVSPIPARP